MIWLRTLIPVAIALAIALVCALLFSDTVAARWLAIALLGLSAFHASYLARLHHWAALPRVRELPLGTAVWGSVLDRLQRLVKTERESRLALTTELEQIHAAVDQLPDGLIVLDQYDLVEWRNDAAIELHGLFAPGRPIHHFIRDPDFTAYLEAGDFARPAPTITLPTRPGRVYELRIHRTQTAHKLLISRDITEHAKLDAMRRDFVANVSHEIRTPVTVIGGFAETLLTLDLDESTRRDYLATILRQSQNMQRLVEDLLTLSSLENSIAPPAETPVDMHALIRTLVSEGQAISQGQHRFEIDLKAPPYLRAAPVEIESAARNLITNAVRYTPAGGTIRLEWTRRDGELCFTVRDSGIGIAPEHIPRLTERFYRVDRGRSRDVGGTGLGLAIVKHVLQRHEGRLDVVSTLGQGSAFSLCLPARRAVEQQPHQDAAIASPIQ